MAAADVDELCRDAIPSARATHRVVLLPGLFAGDWIWSDTSACLQQHGFRVVTLPDPIAALDASVNAFRQRVARLLDQQQATGITLVGNSLGGLIALDMAVQYPSLIKSVVVSGCPGLGESYDLGLEKMKRGGTRELAQGIGEKVFYDKTRLTPEMIDRTIPVIAHFMNLMRVLMSLRGNDVEQMLKSVSCPVLLLWGQNDIITPVSTWERQLPLIQRGVLKTIAECGHSPMVEKPDEFNAILLDFLLQTELAGSSH